MHRQVLNTQAIVSVCMHGNAALKEILMARYRLHNARYNSQEFRRTTVSVIPWPEISSNSGRWPHW